MARCKWLASLIAAVAVCSLAATSFAKPAATKCGFNGDYSFFFWSPEETLAGVRIYAAKHQTTVNQLVREHLQWLARQEARTENAREELLQLIDESKGRLGPGWKWDREDAYQSRVLPRHQRPALRRAGKKR